MLFNSLQYLFFLPIVVVVYFLVAHRHRWAFLLAASYYFYMCWKIEYLFLIMGSTLSVYAAAIIIEKYEKTLIKRWSMLIAALLNLGMLFVFKYYNFFNDSLRALLNHFNVFYDSPAFKLLLPVGISFYTFQAVGYLVDVYRGERKAERHLGLFAVFVAFFPQLVAGPIERSRNLLPQFYEKHEFDYHRVADGLKLIAWGLFKKIVIADRIAVYVDQVFTYPDQYVGGPALLASLFFTIQVYCDFSGYSDIAIGSAQILGFRLMKNFDRPYHAKSVSEFWRRWHISLSTWLRDYIYNPVLIGTRNWGQPAIVFSLFVTFLACGLWHGAYWTFIIFGLLHGMVLSLEAVTKKRRKKLKKIVPPLIYDSASMVLTFAFVCMTFIFFRSSTVSDAFLVMKNIAAIDVTNLGVEIPQMSRIDLMVTLLSVAILECVHLIQRKMEIRKFIEQKSFMFRWSLYVASIGFILFFRKTGVEFIYFQF